MNKRSDENLLLYGSAVAQGLALVTFPAISGVFLDPAFYDLNSTQYGFLFLPQAAAAIISSLVGSTLVRRLGAKRIFFVGLLANLASLGFLFSSQFLTPHSYFVYGTLLLATTFLGLGFGWVVPSLNAFAASFNPQRVDAAVLTVNALLGLGTVLAPVLAWIFVGWHIWWGLPAIVFLGIGGLAVLAARAPLRAGEPDSKVAVSHSGVLGRRFWLYAGFAFVYGLCETINGNWAPVFMTSKFHSAAGFASLSLTGFWAGVTGGRVFFGRMAPRIPQKLLFRVLPLLLSLSFLSLPSVAPGAAAVAVMVFVLLGLGCSALLPLVISFGQEEFSQRASAVPGLLIGFYQMGYGLAAFGLQPLRSFLRVSLSTMYAWSSVVALILAALAFLMVRSPEPKKGR